MKRRWSIASVFLLVLASSALAIDYGADDDWPQFRGWRASGVADGQNPPSQWHIGTWSNVRWKTQIPGLGHASPIVTRGYVFIVTASSSNPEPRLRVGLYGDIASVEDESPHSWHLYCLCKYTGRVIWRRTLHAGVPKIKRHAKSTHANSTPATNGLYVAVFLGSEGLYCYDICGNLLWKRDLGVLDSGYYRTPDAQWGFGSSPIIFENMVIVQCDVQENSCIAAFDVRDGHELWRTAREDVPTWSTPTIYERDARAELIVNGYKHVGGYDPFTGKEVWWLRGGGDIPVPTPVVSEDLVFLSSAHGKEKPLYAVRIGSTGDITPPDDAMTTEDIAWYKPRDGIYMQTPIVYGGYLYACRNNGVLSCYEAVTGERVYRERLGRGNTGFSASAVAADGRLYFTSEDGTVYVVEAGPTFELLATNTMGEVCMATPAISGGMLIVRTKSHVYGIGDPASWISQRIERLHAPCCTFGRQRTGCRPRVLRRIRPVLKSRDWGCVRHLHVGFN